MLSQNPFTRTTDQQYQYTKEMMEKVIQKTPDDLAESLEIMMIEARPVGTDRAALRGAICLLRKEKTDIDKETATKILQALKALWLSQRLEARVLIVQRSIDFVGAAE